MVDVHVTLQVDPGDPGIWRVVLSPADILLQDRRMAADMQRQLDDITSRWVPATRETTCQVLLRVRDVLTKHGYRMATEGS